MLNKCISRSNNINLEQKYLSEWYTQYYFILFSSKAT